jgi:regulatory protein
MASSTERSAETFGSAEDWLAARGVRRDPIEVAAPPPADAGDGPPPSAREALRLATEAPAAPLPDTDPASRDDGPADLADEVARAMTFLRRATASQPQSEGRLRRKLKDRDTPRAAIDQALRQARQERLVDDAAMAAAIAEERRGRGHALSRIRMDLRKREFGDDVIDAALARHADEDPEAVAFAAARAKAGAYRSLDAEKAYRRLVGYLARRGHPEGLARKVARQVIFVDREPDQITGH